MITRDPVFLKLFAVLLTATMLGVCSAKAIEIPGDEERTSLLERAERLAPIPLEEVAASFTDAADPFYEDEPEIPDDVAGLEQGVADAARRAADMPSDREVLDALAERIQPSGIVESGGERVLLFGERRVRPGDILQLNYEGSSYRITVLAIGRNSFILQLGEEQISKTVQ